MSKLIPLPEVVGLPLPRSPLSQGVVAGGDFVFASGQGPYDLTANKFVRGTIADQTRLTLECIDRVLRAAGTSRDRIVS